MMERRIWIDGDLVAWGEAKVHVLSHSHQRGSLIFDYLSVHEGKNGAAIFRLEPHIDRFLASAEAVGLEFEWSRTDLITACVDTVRANQGSQSVKICAYIPSIEVDIVPQDPGVSVAIAAYENLGDVISKNRGDYHFRPELSVLIEQRRRNRRPDIIEPQIKIAANYASPMMAKVKARQAGYDEILLLDEDGYLTEAPAANFFLVDAEGTLVTSPEDYVLHGITRASVAELIEAQGLELEVRRVAPAELREAAEAFLTVTSMGVWPIVKVDGDAIGDGVVGPITQALRQRLERIVVGEDPEFSHWLTPAA